jgi:hypothetical protein
MQADAEYQTKVAAYVTGADARDQRQKARIAELEAKLAAHADAPAQLKTASELVYDGLARRAVLDPADPEQRKVAMTLLGTHAGCQNLVAQLGERLAALGDEYADLQAKVAGGPAVVGVAGKPVAPAGKTKTAAALDPADATERAWVSRAAQRGLI